MEQAPNSAPEQTLIGQTFGKYLMLESIGSGGMGEVYLAKHSLIGRLAAIKVLSRGFSKEKEFVQRFFNEARAASAIRHSGIVEVYDYGNHTDGCPYLVMEFLEGQTLRAHMARGPIAVEQALGYIEQLASVLAAAHDAGIVHRDLKPENIFLVPDSLVAGGYRVKLLDFGIAKLASGTDSPIVTRSGDVIGTPVYMAPEQCRGTGKYDARTDLYSLGCIFFELLTGRPPFVKEFAGDYFLAHIGTRPPSVDDLREETPAGLGGLVRRLLEKDPADRIDSAGSLLDAMEALEDDERTRLDGVPVMTGRHTLDAETLAPRRQAVVSETALGQTVPDTGPAISMAQGDNGGRPFRSSQADTALEGAQKEADEPAGLAPVLEYSEGRQFRGSQAVTALNDSESSGVAAQAQAKPKNLRRLVLVGSSAAGVLLLIALGGSFWSKGDKAKAEAKDEIEVPRAPELGSSPEGPTAAEGSNASEALGAKPLAPADATEDAPADANAVEDALLSDAQKAQSGEPRADGQGSAPSAERSKAKTRPKRQGKGKRPKASNPEEGETTRDPLPKDTTVNPFAP